MRRIDVAILGGGCAGLSLARELARAEAGGRAVPSVLVIEPREAYTADRTWCFWSHRDDPPDPRVRYRWSGWRFSTPERSVVQRSDAWRYGAVPAQTFYDEALAAIETSEAIELRRGTVVLRVAPTPEGVQVATSDGEWLAGRVVDTRPPSRSSRAATKMVQAFAGAEVEGDAVTGEPDVVGLMDHMVTDDHGFRFDYDLPLTPTRRLVEATRFSAGPVTTQQLDADLNAALSRAIPGGRFRIVRRERGFIPMGLPLPAPSGDARWVYAGTRGGAVRAATGYAFHRMQAWARDCARSVVDRGRVLAHPSPPWSVSSMDRLFLDVLRGHPGLAPGLFMALGERVPPDALVRFLMDRARPSDLLRVVGALPPGPFLQRIGRGLAPRRRSREPRGQPA